MVERFDVGKSIKYIVENCRELKTYTQNSNAVAEGLSPRLVDGYATATALKIAERDSL